MAAPGKNGGWKPVTQNRLSGSSTSSTTRNGSSDQYKSEKSGSSSSSSVSITKKKDGPGSTTEPYKPRPVALFQEGDDVFFHTDDGQHVLGTVGQVIGQMCQVLFGDGTQQWAPFKRIKKFGATLNQEDSSNSKEEVEVDRKPMIVIPKEESTEMFCTVCGVKKKISVSKARAYKPEGPNVFKCRRCSKVPRPTSSNGHINLSQIKLPIKGHLQATSVIANSLHSGSVTTLLKSQNGITIPTASGSLSIFRQTPAPTTLSISNGIVRSSSLVLPVPTTSKPKQQIAGPSRLKSNLCFNCEEDTEPDDRIPCNLCGRFCHLNCLPLTSPPPLKGDKFWDLMCSSCGTQSPDGNSRSRVFSVRRNISSWSDVAYLALRCLTIERPDQLFFDLETDILQFFEKNMSNLKLPKHYTAPPVEDRKKYIINGLITSRLRFINGKEVKKRGSLWGLRTDQLEQKIKQESSVQIVDKRDHSKAQLLQSVAPKPSEITSGGNGLSGGGNVIKSSRKQSLPTKRIAGVGHLECSVPSQNKLRDVISVPFGAVPSPPPSGVLINSGSIYNLANFVQSSSVLPKKQNSETLEARKLGDHEAKRKHKRSHQVTPGTTPERLKNTDSVPAHKKPKLSTDCNIINKVLSNYFGRQNETPSHSMSPTKKISVSPFEGHGIKTQDLKLRDSILILSPSKQPSEEKKKHRDRDFNRDKIVDKPKAIKSAQIVPVPHFKPQTEVDEKESSEDETPKKADKSIKPKLKNLKLKSGILKRSPSKTTKLGVPLRGRPPGVKNLKKAIARSRNGEELKNGNASARQAKSNPLKLTAGVSGLIANCNGAEGREGRMSKRIMEKNAAIAVENGDSIENLLASHSSSLMTAVLFGGYRTQCLPLPPLTEAEQREEFLQVYGHYRTEKQNEAASMFLGRSETETRSQTRRKSELFGRRTRDLNDYDSYDVVAKKVDALGVSQYFIIWKGDDDEDEIDKKDLLDFDSLGDGEQDIVGGAPTPTGAATAEPAPNLMSELFAQESRRTCSPITVDLTCPEIFNTDI